MQLALDFGLGGDLWAMRQRLSAAFGPVEDWPRRTSMEQLVKSMISSRTPDAVSSAAYKDLRRIFPRWPDLAAAELSTLSEVISEVTFAGDKAIHLKRTLGLIAKAQPDFDRAFLGERPVPDALTWLQRLPGVGLKIAAATLNFSTLCRPAFVADCHVLRVFRRLGLMGCKAGVESAYAGVMGAAPQWTAMDLIELHDWLKHLGQTICRPIAPRCATCPLRSQCRACDRRAAIPSRAALYSGDHQARDTRSARAQRSAAFM